MAAIGWTVLACRVTTKEKFEAFRLKLISKRGRVITINAALEEMTDLATKQLENEDGS